MKNNFLLFAVLSVMVLAACGGGDKTPAQELEALKKERDALDKKITTLEATVKPTDSVVIGAPIQIETVGKSNFMHYIEVQGKVESDLNVMVSAKTPGIITSVNVSEGQSVKAGQVLATLDGGIVRQGLSALETQLQLAKTVYEKQQRLWDQKIGTEVQLLQAKANYEGLQKQVGSTREQLALYTITAPFSGTLDMVTAKQGEAAQPGMPLFQLIGGGKSKIMASIPETYYGKVKQGAEVRMTINGVEVPATVKTVGQAINASSRTFPAEFVQKGGNVDLAPNMVVEIQINDYAAKGALTAPVNTVQRDEKGAYILVAEKANKGLNAKKKYVTTGLAFDGRMEIKSGLAEGDQIITTGYSDLNEGQPVTL